MTRACRDCKWAALQKTPMGHIVCKGKTSQTLHPATYVCDKWEPWRAPDNRLVETFLDLLVTATGRVKAREVLVEAEKYIRETEEKKGERDET